MGTIGDLPVTIWNGVDPVAECADDVLLGPRVNPLEGSPMSSCGKLGPRARSRLPTLERGRGSSWEPRD